MNGLGFANWYERFIKLNSVLKEYEEILIKTNNMKKLPEYFCIKRDEYNPLWQKYIDWLNEKYNSHFIGQSNNYYGYNGHVVLCANDFSGNIITLEQWDECVNRLEIGTIEHKEIINKMNNMEKRKIKGYKLIKEYPGSRSLESIMSINCATWYLDNFILKYPEFWEPVYEDEKLEIVDWKTEDNYTHAWIMFKGKLTQEIIDKIKEVL